MTKARLTARGLRGVFAPTITPFTARASQPVFLGAFERNVEAHVRGGVHGIVVCGSTGEAPLLSEAERSRTLRGARFAIDSTAAAPAGGRAGAGGAAAQRRPVLLMGAGAESTRATLARCRAAAEDGADGVLVVAPHYYSPSMTPEALLSHYTAVADGSPLPIVLYNIPKYMHFALPQDVVSALAAHENVIGIKDSSGDEKMLRGYLALGSDKFSVLTGSSSSLAFAVSNGGGGGIVAAAVIAPEVAAAVYAAAAARRPPPPEALAWMSAAGAFGGKHGAAGIKFFADRIGLVGGVPRRPLLPLDAAGQSEGLALLKARQLLLEGGVIA